MKVLDVARMERHQKFLEKHMPAAEKAVEAMQDKLSKREPFNILMTGHKNKRSFERACSNRHVLTVLEDGYAIEYQGSSGQSTDVLMMGYVKISGGGYRPLHVAVIIEETGCIVKTVYDPRSKAEQWDNNYETRLFFI